MQSSQLAWRPVLGSLTCLSFVTIAGALVAGCGSHLEIIVQARPNPFVDKAKKIDFQVRPIEMLDLTVDEKPESEYVASLEPDSALSWEEDKKAINQLFLQTLMEEAKDYGINVSETAKNAQFLIVPTVRTLETGYYRIPAWNAVSRIDMNVQIQGKAGDRLDEIHVFDTAAFDAILAPSTGGRLRSIAKVLGQVVAEYLNSRVHP